MKTAILCGITLLAAAPVFAQSSATEAAPGQMDTKTVTMTGCVGGSGSDAKAITLTNALVIPGTAQPGQLDQTPSPLPPTASSPATQPSDPTLPPPSATASPAPPSASSPVGTSGSKTPAPTATTGASVTGTAPAGSSGSSVSGYQLSGVDMQPWIGKRVQVIGTFAPPAASTGTGASAIREFKVQTVQPATGPCPR